MALQEMITDLPYTITGPKASRALVVVATLAILLMVALLLAVIVLSIGYGRCSDNGGQLTNVRPGYLEALAQVVDNMNAKVDPCEDFYSYACGGWQKNNPLLPGQGSVGVTVQTRLDMDRKWRSILEQPTVKTDEHSAERKMKDFYNVCVQQVGRLNDGGKQFVKDALSEIGGWYVTHPDTWKSSWNFAKALAMADVKYKNIMPTCLFYKNVAPFKGDFDKTYIEISVARIYGLNNPNGEAAFGESIRRMGTLLLRDSGEPTRGNPGQRLDVFVNDVTTMYEKLTKIVDEAFVFPVSNPDYPVAIKVSLAEMNANFSIMDWTQWVQQLVVDYDVTPSTEVKLIYPTYFKSLTDLLQNQLPNSDRVLNNFVMWIVSYNMASILSWEYQSVQQDFITASTGSQHEPMTSQKMCMELLKERFPEPLAVEFLRTHTTEATEEQLTSIVKQMTIEFMKQVENYEWMDKTTKDIALDKLTHMRVHVGIPDDIDDPDEVDMAYAELSVNKSEGFYRVLLNTNLYQRRKFTSSLKQDWISSRLSHGLVLTNNMYYTAINIHPYNMLVVLNAGSHPPYFYSEGPSAVNYGAIGNGIALQIANSVYSNGRYFRSIGLRSGDIWWTNQTLQKYNENTQCLQDFLNNLKMGPFTVDGSHHEIQVQCTPEVVDTFISKIAGLKLAHKVFNSFQEKHPDTSRVSSLFSMNQNQLFFTTAAQKWCSNEEERLAYRDALHGRLSNKLIVNGMMSQLQGFADAFKCSSSSKLQSKKQCHF